MDFLAATDERTQLRAERDRWKEACIRAHVEEGGWARKIAEELAVDGYQRVFEEESTQTGAAANEPANLPTDLPARLRDHPHTFADRCACVRCAAAVVLEKLQREKALWRSVADGLYEAGTHPTAHDYASYDYLEALKGDRND